MWCLLETQFLENILTSISRRCTVDRATAQAVSHRPPTAGQVLWDLWWTKWYWGRIPQILSFLLTILIPPTVPHSSITLSSTLFGLDAYSVNKIYQYFKIFIGVWYKLISYAEICWFEPLTVTCLSRFNADVVPWSSFQIFTHPPFMISFLSQVIHCIFCSWKSVVK
jgi:hypothetical protein